MKLIPAQMQLVNGDLLLELIFQFGGVRRQIPVGTQFRSFIARGFQLIKKLGVGRTAPQSTISIPQLTGALANRMLKNHRQIFGSEWNANYFRQ